MTTSSENKEKRALERIAKLKQLCFRLKSSSNNSADTESIQTATSSLEPAYKRRGVELKEITPSSEKIANGFDERI